MIEILRTDAVCQIALNRPEKRNALNMALCADLLRALDDAESSPEVRAILLTGNGPAFCAGMDLEEALRADQNALADLHERLFTVIRRARKPIVAAVRGPALAGGTGLVANAHIAIASPDARFGLTEIRIGLWPLLVIRAVTQAIGERRTTELSLTGRIFTADEAKQFGLVSEIASDPKARALEIAHALAASSQPAIRTGLEYADRIRGLPWDEAGKIGHRMRDQLMESQEFRQLVTEFFAARKRESH